MVSKLRIIWKQTVSGIDAELTATANEIEEEVMNAPEATDLADTLSGIDTSESGGYRRAFVLLLVGLGCNQLLDPKSSAETTDDDSFLDPADVLNCVRQQKQTQQLQPPLAKPEVRI